MAIASILARRGTISASIPLGRIPTTAVALLGRIPPTVSALRWISTSITTLGRVALLRGVALLLSAAISATVSTSLGRSVGGAFPAAEFREEAANPAFLFFGAGRELVAVIAWGLSTSTSTRTLGPRTALVIGVGFSAIESPAVGLGFFLRLQAAGEGFVGLGVGLGVGVGVVGCEVGAFFGGVAGGGGGVVGVAGWWGSGGRREAAFG